MGKAHKEADAKARKEQLLQEKEVLLPQLEQAQKAAENGAKEPEEIQRLMLSIQKEKENLERYTNLENLLREIENGFPADRETGNGRYSSCRIVRKK